jgi:hypothetical protein
MSMSLDQLERVKEFQCDFCELVDEDFLNPTFQSWYDSYEKYVKYGTVSMDSRGADRPPHKPPTP